MSKKHLLLPRMKLCYSTQSLRKGIPLQHIGACWDLTQSLTLSPEDMLAESVEERCTAEV